MVVDIFSSKFKCLKAHSGNLCYFVWVDTARNCLSRVLSLKAAFTWIYKILNNSVACYFLCNNSSLLLLYDTLRQVQTATQFSHDAWPMHCLTLCLLQWPPDDDQAFVCGRLQEASQSPCSHGHDDEAWHEIQSKLHILLTFVNNECIHHIHLLITPSGLSLDSLRTRKTINCNW